MERSFQKNLEKESTFEAMKSRFVQPKQQAGQTVLKEFANEEFSNKETITDCDNKTTKCTVKTCLNGKCNYEDPQPQKPAPNAKYAQANETAAAADCDNKTTKCTVKTCLNGKCNYEDPQPQKPAPNAKYAQESAKDCDNKTTFCSPKTCLGGKCNYEDIE